jgi:hypothetical protein
MEAVSSSETSVNYHITQRDISEDGILQRDSYWNLYSAVTPLIVENDKNHENRNYRVCLKYFELRHHWIVT